MSNKRLKLREFQKPIAFCAEGSGGEAEMDLSVLAFNLKRVMNIVGCKELLARLAVD